MLYSLAKCFNWLLVFFLSYLLLLTSCTTVRNYPVRQPFVYKTNIELHGKFSTDDRKELVNQLEQQLHDSMQVRSVQKLIGWKNGPRLFYREIVNPPVFDSLNADKSVEFMRALLNAQGYYRDTITYDTSLHIRGSQYRTHVNFQVYPGKLITLDSVWYNMSDTVLTVEGNDTLRYTLGNDTLQKITLQAKDGSLLKPGQPFSKSLISSEFDRLVDVYRNNGYLRFSFEELLAVYDTVGLALLRPTLDPFEQAQQLQELQRRRQNPTADLEIRLRTNRDSSHLIRYYVGNITIYPDLTIDTGLYVPKRSRIRDYNIIAYRGLFKPRVVANNVYLHHNQLYSQRNYLRTLNRFNSLGAWRLVNIEQIPRAGTDTVDFVIKLTPARKYQATFNIEGSQNWGNPLVGSLGVGVNAGLQNRNFARAANLANSNLRYGLELNPSDDFVQTQQITLTNTISFPRMIPRFGFVPPQWRENQRTIFSLNAGYTDRINFFELYTFNTLWGYELARENKLLSIRIPNIEFSFLTKGDSLIELIKRSPSYNYIFNDGLVSSVLTSYTVAQANKNRTAQTRFNIEASGLLTGFIRNQFLDSNLYRFVKFDAEYRQSYKIRRTEFAWRVFGGLGIGLPRFTADTRNRFLPFFKQYFAGGPNSMRAWALRKLGPGSTIKERNIAPERFGDMQLEANTEYRFYLTEIGGVRLNSALFVDMGNVWLLRKSTDFPNGEFRLNKLWQDLAIGAGTGLRVDFGFFLVRLDYAYKVKNPSPENEAERNKWFYNWKPFNGQLQLGVSYPF